MVADFSKPLTGGVSKSNWLDESRYFGSNVVEGVVNALPALYTGLQATAQKGAAAVIADFNTPESSANDQFLQQYAQELQQIQENDKRLNTIKNIISENVSEPLAALTDSFFTAAEGDRSKIKNANLKENIAQGLGNLIAPIPLGGALSKTTSLLGRTLEGAAVGTGFGVAAGGEADTLQDYGKNIVTGAAIGSIAGAAGPAVVNALGKGAEAIKSKARQITDFAKGTTTRIQQGVQQMRRDQISESMRTIGASQDRVRAQQNQVRVQTEAANSPGEVPKQAAQSMTAVRLKSGVRMDVAEHPVVKESIANIEQQAGRELTPEEKQSVTENFIGANMTMRRRQVAVQKLKELRAQSEMESLQVKQVGVEQQMQKIKEFLTENPKPLLPSKKQKIIRANLVRAEQMNAKLKAQEPQPVGPVVVPEDQKLFQEALKQDLPPLIKQAEIDTMTLRGHISEMEAKLADPKMKVNKDFDGSLENAIAETFKTNKLNHETFTKAHGGLDKNNSQSYLRHKGGLALDEFSARVKENLGGEHELDWKALENKIVEFANEHSSPAQYFKARAVKSLKDDMGRLGADLTKREAELAQLKETQASMTIPDRVNPSPPRQALLDYISNQGKELERIRNIQQTKIGNHLKERLGVDSTDPISLKTKIEELQLQSDDYKIQQADLENRLAQQAEVETKQLIASEQYFKDQGLSYAGYEDGNMKVALFDPSISKSASQRAPETKQYKIKRNGKEFTVALDDKNNPVWVARKATPVEQAWYDSQDGVATQLDRLFGATEESFVLTEKALKEGARISDARKTEAASKGKLEEYAIAYIRHESVAEYQNLLSAKQHQEFQGALKDVRIGSRAGQEKTFRRVEELVALYNEPPKKTGSSNDETPSPEGSGSRFIKSESRLTKVEHSNEDKQAIREYFQPIQNGADEIHQGLGNLVAELTADTINGPARLLKDFAGHTGADAENYNPNNHVKQLVKLFGTSKEDVYTYNHIAQMPERLNADQRSLVAGSQDFWLKHRDVMEGMDIDLAELHEGSHMPRERDYNVWFKAQSAEKQTQVKDIIKSKEDGYYNEDKVMGEFTEKRKYNVIPEKEMPSYRSGAVAIVTRIKKIAQQEALQKFFGGRLKKGVSYQTAVDGLLDEFNIQGNDRRDAKLLLQRLFDKTPYTDNAVLNLANRFRYAALLGKVVTAVKQPILGATRNAFRFGVENAVKAIGTINDPALQGYGASLVNDIQKGDIDSKLKILDMAATGLFRWANQKEAAMTIGSAYHHLVDHAHNAVNGKVNKAFGDYMTRRYGEDVESMDALIVKLAAQKGRKYAGFDSDVINAATTLARDRGSLALGKADKTAASLDPKNIIKQEGYKLLTYNIKDTNTLVDMTHGEMKRGNVREGLTNILTQVGLATFIYAAETDQLLRLGSAAQTTAQGHGPAEGYTRGGLPRFWKQVANAYVGLMPLLSTYSVDKLLDSHSWGQVAANAIFKGLETVPNTIEDTVKGSLASLQQSNREGRFPDLSGALNPDLNPSLKNLPPSVLTETWYNIVDPAIRGNKAMVVLKEQEKLQREAAETKEAKAAKLAEQKVSYRNAGVASGLAGTAAGAIAYKKATNEKYNAYVTASESFTKEDYSLGMKVAKGVRAQSYSERKAYFETLPDIEQRAYMADVWRHAMEDATAGKISKKTLDEVENVTREYSTMTTMDKAGRAIKKLTKKLVNSGR